MNLFEVMRAGLNDRYTIERELGGGGMSVVFVAMEHALGRRVVIKVLSPELGQTVNVQRFKQEIATLATLQHPQIVPIFHAGQVGDLLYYVMPFVAGQSLIARVSCIVTSSRTISCLRRNSRCSPTSVSRNCCATAPPTARSHRRGCRSVRSRTWRPNRW